MRAITFYSYKGGTGRTLALANVASFAARVGKRVFVLDMDLEAPGVTYKFSPTDQRAARATTGLVGYLLDLISTGEKPRALAAYSVQVKRLAGYVEGRKTPGRLWLMPAGRVPDPGYFGDLRRLNLDGRVADGSATSLFMQLFESIREAYRPDLLLIDARTGITGTNSLALAELADEAFAFVLDMPEQREGTRTVLRSLAPLAANGRPVLHAVLSRVPVEDAHLESGWLRTEADERRMTDLRRYLTAPTHPAKNSLDDVTIHQLHHSPSLVEQEEVFLTLLGRPGIAENALAWDYMRLARSVIEDDAAIAKVASVLASSKSPEPHIAALMVDDPELRAGRTKVASLGVERSHARNLLERVAAQRLLVETDPAALPQLGQMLITLSTAQAEVGDRLAAVETAAEGVEVFERLARASREGQLELAQAVSTYALRLTEAGELAEARQQTLLALDLFRSVEATARDRDSYLATSLVRLAALSSDSSDDQMAALEEAVVVLRRLMRRSRKHVDLMRSALVRQSEILASRGDHEQALERAREALADWEIHRVPDYERAGLVEALDSFANRLLDAGRPQEARVALEDALTVSRSAKAEVGAPLVAKVLATQSVVLARLGKFSEAEKAARSAIGRYRRMSERDPSQKGPLAVVLRDLGNLLSQRGRFQDAEVNLTESVAIVRQLAERDVAAIQTLARALSDLATVQDRTARHRDALKSAEEAIGLFRGVSAGRHDDLGLAIALTTFSKLLMGSGRVTEALHAGAEAVDLFEGLTSSNSQTQLAFATSLLTYSNVLQAAGDGPQAIHMGRRSVETYRSMRAQGLDVAPLLAAALRQLGEALAALGQSAEALPELAESVDILRGLVAANSLYAPELAKALHSQGLRLMEVGSPVNALASFQEAVAIRRDLSGTDAAYAGVLLESLVALRSLLEQIGDPLATRLVQAEILSLGGEGPA